MASLANVLPWTELLDAEQRAGHEEWASTYEPLRIGDYDRGKR